MSLIKWTAEFQTGIAEVDEQHKQLVDIVNRFAEAQQKGQGSRLMNGILNELIGYTQEHFAAEERLMAENEYEDLKAHQAQHRQLLQKVERFQFEFNEEGKRVTADVQHFLKYWLTSHILKDDMAYAQVLRPENVDA